MSECCGRYACETLGGEGCDRGIENIHGMCHCCSECSMSHAPSVYKCCMGYLGLARFGVVRLGSVVQRSYAILLRVYRGSFCRRGIPVLGGVPYGERRMREKRVLYSQGALSV